MLRSRVFRRLPFQPLPRPQIPALIRGHHPIYQAARRRAALLPGGLAAEPSGPARDRPP